MSIQTHEEKYAKLCAKYHVSWDTKSPHLVGVTVETLIEKFREDEHLNNIPLRRWDNLAIGFISFNRNTGLSLAEVVCMQKHAAVQLIRKATKWQYVLPSFVSNGCEKGGRNV
jgi:hypothetical protein